MVAKTNNLADLLEQLDPLCTRRVARLVEREARRAAKPRLRSRVDFTLEEITVPEGRYKGELILPEFQPVGIDLLRQMDATPHRRYAVTGCVQSGKTLIAVIAVVCWHLFELGHAVIFGVPELKMAKKKWEKELLPVIVANPWMRRMLPTHGSGSKGGFDGTVAFRNGSTLEFMGATGNDARRSSSTGQVLVKDEVDRYDEARDASREAAPAITMEDRVASHGDNAYIYENCTRTTTRGRINVQVNAGTAHTPHSDCPHCGAYVSPTREHFVGFEDAATIEEARTLATFICPACACVLSEADRYAMVSRLVSVPRTQTVRPGAAGAPLMEGPLPATDTFSYQWNAFFNRFWTIKYLGGAEWKSLTGADDDDDGEKQWKQKRWAIAVEPTEIDLAPLTSDDIYQRHNFLGRGEAPHDAVTVTAGVDIRKSQIHYVLVAWRATGSGHIVDYGVLDVRWEELGLTEALPAAMVELGQSKFLPGVRTAPKDETPARILPVGYKLHDLSWSTDEVREGLRRLGMRGVRRARGIFGRGQSEPPGAGSYVHPTAISERIAWIGRQCHLRKQKDLGTIECFANSDEWKSFVRRAIGPESPEGASGALTAWKPITADDKRLVREFGRQIRAETQVRKFVPRRGEVDVWEHRTSSANHWGDCLYYACVAANLEGIRFARQPRAKVPLSQQVAAKPVQTAAAQE